MITGFSDETTTSRRVKAMLAVRSWSFQDLADNTTITKQGWAKIVKSNSFTAMHISMLAKVFGCSCDLLIQPMPDEYRDDEWLNAPMGGKK